MKTVMSKSYRTHITARPDAAKQNECAVVVDITEHSCATQT
jgi:hypothetical protein